MSIAGLILAAGESRRMGFPKALLTFRGETFLDSLIHRFSRYCSPLIVVLGAGAERIQAGMTRAADVRIVLNANWRDGQLSSMQCGLREVPADAQGVLFTLVDHPGVQEATLRAICDPPLPLLRVPRLTGLRGHPIFFRTELAREFLAAGAAETARDVVERHAAEIEYLDVDDSGVLADIDDPEAYRRLTAGENAL